MFVKSIAPKSSYWTVLYDNCKLESQRNSAGFQWSECFQLVFLNTSPCRNLKEFVFFGCLYPYCVTNSELGKLFM